ncbi:Protoheme IX farnesyltransferase, mitochondrial [Vitis vinifera]|uniref:Protoheme IX farnesyltransferase, mitochondrial n=1 Tax=Vitis vinifera TaxID=29760 RepID=A0A438BX90_VITVI|nr:Protoheme IX farnesyltransferase, mitochondrial [Vitis vinifera]
MLVTEINIGEHTGRRWAAAAGQVSLNGMILPAALYFWQIPHFMALAYLCRDDYAAGELWLWDILHGSCPIWLYRKNSSARDVFSHVLLSLQHVYTFCFLTFYSFHLFYAFRYRMLSFADASGRRTAVVALRNSLYLIPLGFIAYDFVTEEAKKYLLIFLKGGASMGGGLFCVEKLRFLGVVPLVEIRGVVSPIEARSNPKDGTVVGTFADAVRKDMTMVGEAIWLELGESEMKCREEQLRWCLEGLKTSVLGEPCICLILTIAPRQRGCLQEAQGESFASSKEVFKKLGDYCGGFVAVDKDIVLLSHLRWARILVKSDWRAMPDSLQVIVGFSSFFHSLVVGSST